MYAYFKGILTEKTENGVVIEVNGIGYNVMVGLSVLENLPPAGSEVTLYTYTAVREDAINLYGFFSRDDVALFRQLLSVSGIGPKGAQSILSQMTADELRFAILSDDAAVIAKAPGIGKKTAQKVVLELKDKLNLEETLAGAYETEGAIAPDLSQGARKEAVMALTALGYNSQEALQAVKRSTLPEDAGVEEILKDALRQMAML